MKPLPFIVNHKDGIKINNYYKNLERSDNSHNSKHAYVVGLRCISDKTKQTLSKLYSGSKSITAKLTYEQALEIRKLYKTGNYTHRSLGLKFGVDHTNIGAILRNKTFVQAE